MKKKSNISIHFHTQLLSVLAFLLLLASCAIVVKPTGGKIDKTPPRVVKYVPDSASLNFNSKEIAIFFDEFVQLKDLNNQLIISPPLQKTPDISVKNTILNIEFDKNEQLKPNTTYSINFGNAIQDIHESNPVENFKYVFSTGSYIDSLVLTGKVENAFDHKTEKGILVLLYRNNSDSAIYKELPDYFGKTKEDGSFLINNIAPGKYKVAALKDGNANYKYDSETESVGFLDSLIDIEQTKSVNLSIFQEPAKKFFLKSSQLRYFGNILFVFNKPSDSVTVRPVNLKISPDDVFTELSKNKDSLSYWFRNVTKDSIDLEVRNGVKIIDTLTFRVMKKEEAMKTNRGTPLKFKLLNSPNKNLNFDLNGEISFSFSDPLAVESIEGLNKSGLKLMEDSIPYSNNSNLFFEQKNLTTIVVKQKGKGSLPASTPILKENVSYKLTIDQGSISDIFGFKNDTIIADFKTREEKQYGSLNVKIDIPVTEGNYVVQLLDEKETILRENNIKKAETITYKYLQAKKYRLKIIFDANSNYKWDTGNVLNKLQPEKVIYNSETINVRSNWDMELDWKVSRD